MALDTTSLAALLEALRSWLIENPDGDIQEFADEHNVDVADLADGWHAYFAQADFSRNYDLGTDTTQAGAQSAVVDSPVNTGNVDDGGVLQQGNGNVANTGDVSATDGSSATGVGDATTIGSGNDNFGDGQNVTTTTLGDGNETAVITQDNDTDITQ